MIDPKVFKQVRKALGLTQEELADAIGLSRITINKMERGKLVRGIPDEIAERLMSLKPRGTVLPPKTAMAVWRRDNPDKVLRNVKDDDDLWDNEEDES